MLEYSCGWSWWVLHGDIFIITDGEVAGTTPLVAQLMESNCRVHVLGIGIKQNSKVLDNPIAVHKALKTVAKPQNCLLTEPTLCRYFSKEVPEVADFRTLLLAN